MRLSWLVASVVSFSALAAETDAAKLYELSSEGTSVKVKAGEKGKVVIAIHPKPGAHVSDEAPLKIELSGSELTLAKDKLTLSDSVNKPAAGAKYADPKFEVPFTAKAPGPKKISAKMTFFVCTENLCSRQQRSLELPVSVE